MLKHQGTVELMTERMVLRRFTLQDAEGMFRHWANDPRVCRFLRWEPHPSAEYTRNLIDQWIREYQSPEYYHWILALKDGRVIGSMMAFDVNTEHMRCEVGYCIGYAFWNKGYTTEALRAVLGYLFDTVGFRRVQATHDMQNPASGRVMEKAGMKREGIMRQYKTRKDGSLADVALCSILKAEWDG